MIYKPHYRPVDWIKDRNMFFERTQPIAPHHKTRQKDYETGADAVLETLTPILETIYAQLNGVRMKEGKTSWYSALDASIDALKGILNIKTGNESTLRAEGKLK